MVGIVFFQIENIGRRFDPPIVEEGRHLLDAEPLDIEGLAADEMDQTLDLLVGTGKLAGASGRGLALGADRRRP